jgi:hypothetical protein
MVWWAAMSLVAALNVVLWLRVRARAFSAPAGPYTVRHVWLSGVFAFVCAFRSVLPRADVQRIVLADTWLSSVVVGRSVATVAELCFVAQAALYLRELGIASGNPLAVRLSRVVLPVIAVAECCSWYAVLTTNFLGNACEESLWTFTSVVLLAGYASVWRASDAALRRVLAATFVVIPGYVAFMTTVDVPMYLSRWRADEAARRVYLAIPDGLADLSRRWIVTRRWEDWHAEIAWMSLYFSVAVWCSLAFVLLPRPAPAHAAPAPAPAPLV